MTEEKYWNLMSRYLANDLSIKETEELLAWLDDDPARADLLKELRDTWDATNNYPEDFEVDTRAGWQRLRAAIEVKQADAEPGTIRRYNWLGIAASLLIITFLGFWGISSLMRDPITVVTLAGQHKEVVLPDGSKVWLNEESELSYYPDLNTKSTREVNLKGEAFFDVAKNPAKRFVVETGQTLTQVLGTSFNVRQDFEEGIKVSVVTGKVSFKPLDNSNQELVLTPGETGLITNEGYAAKSNFNNENFLFWKNRQLTFDNATLSEVLKTLETSYRVKFQLEDEELLKHRITTSFNNAEFGQAVEILESLLDLNIHRSGSVYVVERKQ